MNLLTSTEPDDERDRRIQRNLIAYYRDEPITGDDIRSVTTSISELDELLPSIDEGSFQPIAPKRPPISEKLREQIAAKLTEFEQYRKDNRQSYLEARRKQARQDYANERAAEGRCVRPYRKHECLPGESPSDRERRLHRERGRRRAGKDETNTRNYLHLTGMTEAEKKERKRQQDAESKKRQRAASKALQTDAEGAAQ
ncbi:hypothetical protein HJB90_14350 [Rhizobium sp. NLR10a]|uniref:hypothetical protein n=1 Tax=Rhizobium sp. NLR10a TaxID=2731105 RepID=UPI001C83FF12|nr:hypothetical protein [Rhizobium sp. NLR10a]MBX5282170.1 hypothetical protein [Rhizobium sp. NLR10a]